ncbi:MAG: glycosyltransferase [Candidatus Aenigmatarchaeota archaeon]
MLIRTVRKIADGIIVSSPDLLEFLPEARFFPVAIDLEEWNLVKYKKDKNDTLTILHAPTDRFIKGTDIILKTINELKKEGYNIRFLLLEAIPRVEVKKFYSKADIVIDQILLGWYGVFSVECMALGKPVCAYIRDDLKKFAKGCPIINVNKENIKEKLKKVIESKNLREKISKKSVKYVKKVHDSVKIAEKIINFYNSC